MKNSKKVAGQYMDYIYIYKYNNIVLWSVGSYIYIITANCGLFVD